MCAVPVAAFNNSVARGPLPLDLGVLGGGCCTTVLPAHARLALSPAAQHGREYKVRPAVSSFQLGQVPLLYCTMHKLALRQGVVMVDELTALRGLHAMVPFQGNFFVDHVLPSKGSRQAGH